MRSYTTSCPGSDRRKSGRPQTNGTPYRMVCLRACEVTALQDLPKGFRYYLGWDVNQTGPPGARRVCAFKKVVRTRGLEPPRVIHSLEPESSASTNSATCAWKSGRQRSTRRSGMQCLLHNPGVRCRFIIANCPKEPTILPQ